MKGYAKTKVNYEAEMSLGHAIFNGMSPLRETVIVTLAQNNLTIHTS